MHITKSLFVDFMNNPKLARWKVHNSEIYKKIRKIDSQEAQEHIIQIGQDVEDCIKQYLEQKYGATAIDLMPRYHKVHTDEESDDEDDDDEILLRASSDLPSIKERTLEAIKAQQKILYQPTFQVGDCIVRADFMIRNGHGYDLFEAKAKSGIRKKIKDNGEEKKIGAMESKFIHDLSFQTHIINQALVSQWFSPLGKINMVYLNRDYIKNGKLNLTELIREDLANTQTEIEVIQNNKPKKIMISDLLLDGQSIEKALTVMRTYLHLPENDFNKIYPREGTKFLEYFGQDKSDFFGTVMGPGIHHSNAEYIKELYYEGKHLIDELSAEDIDWFNEGTQKYIATYLKCKQSWSPIIDSDAIRTDIINFQYPICFYDYETISVPIPFLDNTRPYLQTVVQYSLHKYYEDGSMKHYGWVFVWEWEYKVETIEIPHDPNKTAQEYNKAITGNYKDLLTQMLEDIGDDLHTSTFMVRYEWFENSRNKEIAKLFPDIAEQFLQINENTFDLMKRVSEWKYFDNKFKSSSSIKKVMPVLAPTMDYTWLDIGRGDKAMLELHNIISGKTPPEQRQKIIQDLLIYCGQDTMAMVRIFEAIKKVS